MQPITIGWEHVIGTIAVLGSILGGFGKLLLNRFDSMRNEMVTRLDRTDDRVQVHDTKIAVLAHHTGVDFTKVTAVPVGHVWVPPSVAEPKPTETQQ